MNVVRIRQLGMVEYEETWNEMSEFTINRNAQTVDEIWVLEHPPVFTLGQASKPEHLLNVGNIPVVQTDRGGQVTYHGPGQLVVYPLINIERLNINVREFVSIIENVIVKLLEQHFKITAYAKKDAPGVYVQTELEEVKVASLGLRIKKGSSFHGLSVNIDMDLEPFARINPCGFLGMKMENVKTLSASENFDISGAGKRLTELMSEALNYSTLEYI